jgi:hypothetical protein
VVSLLKDRETGVVGLAGSAYLPKNPAPWWVSLRDMGAVKDDGVLYYNIIHGPPPLIENLVADRNPRTDWKETRVEIIDGVFMAVRREVWMANKFDDKTFNNFHFYDLDFSASVGLKYKNYVTPDILVKHFSQSAMDVSWLKSAVAFHHKWKDLLPLNRIAVPKELIGKFEKTAALEFCEMCAEKNFYPGLFFKCWLNSLKNNYFSARHYKLLQGFLHSRISSKEAS